MLNTAARWSGLLLIAGSALLAIALLAMSFTPAGDRPLGSQLVTVPLLFSSMLLMLALPAMYARQAEAAGMTGLIGHGLLQTGMLLLFLSAAAVLRDPANYRGSVENEVDFGLGLAVIFGLLLTAWATLRAGVYPRGAGILLAGATAGMFFDFLIAENLPPIAGQIGGALLGVCMSAGFAWVGAVLLRGQSPEAAGAMRPRPSTM